MRYDLVLAPLSLFLFVLYFYLRTLCATFNINDSGETILDCDLLSIAHSPGYPLHTLLGRIFCLLPLGQPMFRLTFASALMGAFSVLMVYLILKKVLSGIPRDLSEKPSDFWGMEIPAHFGALLFAFSYQQWFQACGAKGSIYTLNTLLAAVTLFLLLKMRDERWFTRCFLLSFFSLGMGFSVHWETQAVLLPAYAWFFLNAQKKTTLDGIFRHLLRPFDLWDRLRQMVGAFGGKRGIVQALTLLLLPMSTYLYLPIRAHGNPVINWWDPGNLQRFLIVVLRKNYAGTDDPRSFSTFHRNLDRFWVHAHHQYGAWFTGLVFLLALLGLVWLHKRHRVYAIGFLLFGGSVLAGVVFYNAPKEGYQWTLDNFFTPVFLSLALFSALGLSALKVGWSRGAASPWASRALRAACFGLALLPLGLNYDKNDQSAYTVSYDEGLNMLKTVRRDGVILCNGDIDILPLWYLQFVEGKRPEVASLTTALAGVQWYRDDISRRWPYLQTSFRGDVPPNVAVEDFLHLQSTQRPFYVTNIYPQGAAWLWSSHALIPDGMLWRLTDTRGQDFAFNSNRVNQLWSQYKLGNLNPPQRKYWDDYTDVMKDSYGQACSFTGDFAMANRMPELARWGYEKALAYHQPQLQGVTYLKLADSELVLSRFSEAVEHYQAALRWEPPNYSRVYDYAPYAYAQMGRAFLIEKDYPNAKAAFQASLGINPGQKEALEGLSEINHIQEQAADHRS